MWNLNSRRTFELVTRRPSVKVGLIIMWEVDHKNMIAEWASRIRIQNEEDCRRRGVSPSYFYRPRTGYRRRSHYDEPGKMLLMLGICWLKEISVQIIVYRFWNVWDLWRRRWVFLQLRDKLYTMHLTWTFEPSCVGYMSEYMILP